MSKYEERMEIVPLLIQAVSGSIVYTSAFLFFKNMLEKYEIRKNFEPKNIKKVLLPPELSYENTEAKISDKIDEKVSGFLSNFIEVIESNVPNEDLNLFYRNLRTLKINISNLNIYNFLSGKIPAAGVYNVKKNKISLREGHIFYSIYHELLHMASAVKVKNQMLCCGFSQLALKNSNVKFGVALNEGYTELLNTRFFNDGRETTIYKFQVLTASMIERIIGREKMQSLYFNANLYGLIDELKKYATEEDIMRFIARSDFIVNYSYRREVDVMDKVDKSYHEVNEFILKLFYEKLKESAQMGNVYMEFAQMEYMMFRQLSIQSKLLSSSSKYTDYDLDKEIESYILSLPRCEEMNPLLFENYFSNEEAFKINSLK